MAESLHSPSCRVSQGAETLSHSHFIFIPHFSFGSSQAARKAGRAQIWGAEGGARSAQPGKRERSSEIMNKRYSFG